MRTEEKVNSLANQQNQHWHNQQTILYKTFNFQEKII